MILAIDTATRHASVALLDDGALLEEHTWQTANHHTVEVPPVVSAMLHRAGITPANLTAIGVASGPGSYTGLRIGMAFAKGLMLSAPNPLPLIGVPTLDITATAQPPFNGTLAVISQAGRGRINGALYTHRGGAWVCPDGPFLDTWAGLTKRLSGPVLLAGEVTPQGIDQITSAVGIALQVSPPHLSLRRAGVLAELTRQRLNEPTVIDSSLALTPIYLST